MKSKKKVEMKQYDMRDPLKNRDLVMFVSVDDCDEFESKLTSFYRKVEISKKILQKENGAVLKNNLSDSNG